MFRMPSYGVQLTVQAEWYNRAGAPAQWTKVGSTATRNIALAGVSPQFPVQQPAMPQQMPTTAGLQVSTEMLILAGLAVGALIFLARR